MDVLTIIQKHIEEAKNKLDPKAIKKLDFPQTEKIATRLSDLSTDCETCSRMLSELEASLGNLLAGNQNENSQLISNLQKNKKASLDQLLKNHKLVQEGYYVSIYMSVGLSLGLVFGLIIFDNLALGLPIGIAVGYAIGSGMDADAKKKGNVI